MKIEVYTCDQCGALHEFKYHEPDTRFNPFGLELICLCGCGNEIEIIIPYEQ